MTASRRRSVIVTMAALAVAVVLVWAAGTGPTDLVGTPGDDAPAAEPTAAATPTATASPDPEQEEVRAERSRVTDVATWVADLVTVAATLGGLWFLAVMFRFVVVQVGRRLPDKQLVLDLRPRPDVEAARASLRRDRDRLADALATGESRNGIVACWILLEEAAGGAGVARLPAETATEFVVRFLHTLDVDPRPVAELAGLYHEARFSTHPLAEDARDRARAALAGVLADLDVASVVPGTQR